MLSNQKKIPEDGHTSQFASPPMEIKTVVKPVINALAILRYLANGRQVTATQISRELSINPSTCFNILRTLVGETVLIFDSVTKTYKVGPGMLQLVSPVMSEESRLQAARPMLQRFARDKHATICMWRRTSPLRNVLIAVEHGEGALRIHLPMGQSLPVLLGSTGRAMAMHMGMTKSQLRAEFKKLRWFQAPSFESFYADALLAQERGWAVDRENFSAGVITLAAPVVAASGAISYSLTALIFRGQFSEERIDQIGSQLAELASEMRAILY